MSVNDVCACALREEILAGSDLLAEQEGAVEWDELWEATFQDLLVNGLIVECPQHPGRFRITVFGAETYEEEYGVA